MTFPGLNPSIKFIAIFLLAGFLMSCSGGKSIQTDLYFGQSKLDGTMVSPGEWDDFKEKYISKVFKEGSTIIQANGNWYDTLTRKLFTEPTYVVIAVNKMTRDLSKKIDSLRYWYKLIHNQQSVLRVDKKVRASL